ncbi:hypothetical protein ABT297_41420 [Dactylosporangium sp. NPDC000555]|uniref:hypothetical protein n=1 Tax=Dactylosporangium sp. NPDC000555 TaxID=3154260 RepID=UPI0033313C27
MRRAAERTLRRYAREHLDTDTARRDACGDGGHAAEPPALLGPGGERVDPAALLDRRGERLWLLTAPGAGGPGPLRWLLRAAWARAAADPAVAQRPVLVDLARLAADGPVTAAAVLRAVTGAATEHGYLVLVAGLDDVGGAVRAAVAGLPGPLARTAPASTIVTFSHAEPVPGFHIPAVVLPDAPPRRDSHVDDGIWEGLAGRLRDQPPWPAGLVADAVAACAAATEPLRWRIIDDLTTLADRRLLFRAALAAGACDDDGVHRAARSEIESLAGTAPAARDARWLSRLLTLLPVLDSGAPAPSPAPHGWGGAHGLPAARSVLLRMAATGRPGSAPLTLLARRDPAAAIAVAEESGSPLALDAVAGAADEPAVARAVLGRCGAVPGWEPALVYRAQLDRAVAAALLAERDRGAGPVAAGRWRGFAMTRGTAYGRLLDDVLARPWAWPPHAAPLLFTLAQVRPPASAAPIAVAALPWAATGAVAATLAVLTCARLAGGHIGPPVATLAVLAGLAVAGALLVRRLHQWRAGVAAVTGMSIGTSASAGAAASSGADTSTDAASAGTATSGRPDTATDTPTTTGSTASTGATTSGHPDTATDTTASTGTTASTSATTSGHPDTATDTTASTGTTASTCTTTTSVGTTTSGRPDTATGTTATAGTAPAAGATASAGGATAVVAVGGRVSAGGGVPVPVRRESVLAAVLGVGPAVMGIAPRAGALAEPLRRACIRAGVPEAEILHLLGALAARRARLGGAVAPAVPEQASRRDERERSGG